MQIMTSSMTPSPKSPEQNEKARKYDRQLRLWGDRGQYCLENAHVCLIHATATGTEILKSLILPGIGSFTIIDEKKLTLLEIGNNFFLEIDGHYPPRGRGQIACEMLREMNPDVQGDFIEESPEYLLQNSSDIFYNFTIVIATELKEKTLLNLSQKLWDWNIPLLVVKCYGLIGYIRLQIVEHSIIQSHPDSFHEDLRLDCPFPDLKLYLDLFVAKEISETDIAKIPYLILLYKYVCKFQQMFNKFPTSYEEKLSLKTFIENDIKSNELFLQNENIAEAIRAINMILVPTEIPLNIEKLFCHENINISTKSKPFWIMVCALKDFVNGDGKGLLPVRGSIPDMISDTVHYIELQNIYKQQAKYEADIIYRRIHFLLQQIGLPIDTISEEEVHLFCKNAYFLHLIEGTSIVQEYEGKMNTFSYCSEELEGSNCIIIYYILLRAVEKFQTEYERFPGTFDHLVEPDIGNLKVSKLLNDWGLTLNIPDDYIHEICRCGGAELHSIAAFMGGIAAHEVIKVITGQYVPIDNTFIYDGITNISMKLRF